MPAEPMRDHRGRFTVVREAPPALEFPYPPCSICGKDTYHDGDGFRCDDCRAFWANDGREGSWEEYREPACLALIEWYNRDDLVEEHENIRHLRTACSLPGNDGHETHRDNDHIFGYTWTDDDPRVVRKG